MIQNYCNAKNAKSRFGIGIVLFVPRRPGGSELNRLFIRVIRTTIRKSPSFSQRFLGRDCGQFADVCLSGSQQGGDGRAAFVSQHVAVGSADFLDQTMCSEQSQLAGDGASTALLLVGIGPGLEEQGAKVPIAKSVDGKLAAVDGLEQGPVVGRPGVEGSGTATVSLDRFADLFDPLEQGDFSAGGRQGGQIAVVGGVGDLGSSFQVHHAFAENAPGFFAVGFGAAMRAGLGVAIDSKIAGLVEGRFDPQDAALFVVHLDRVGLEGVFDSNPFGALFQIADNFPFKVAAHLSMSGHPVAQKAHDIGAGKAGDGVPDQGWVDGAQGLGALEHHIRGVFALLGCPVVLESQRPAYLRRQRMVLPEDSIQLIGPIQVQLPVHQPLRSGEVADPGKTVLFLGVVHLVTIHLPAQPFPAIEADLNLEGKPALQAQMHEAKLRMQMVEIEVLALAAFQLEFQLLGLAVAAQKIGPAGLDTTKNPDQAILEAILFNEFPRQNFFAGVAGGEIAKRPSGYFGQSQSGRLNALGQLNGKFLEVLEENAFDLQVGVHRSGIIKRWQAAFESQAVKARKNADDIGLVLGYKGIGSVTGVERMACFHMPHLSCRGHSCPQEKRPDEKDQKSATRPRPKADFAVQASFNHRLCPLLVAALPLWVIRGSVLSLSGARALPCAPDTQQCPTRNL